jgi:hypothetical protein
MRRPILVNLILFKFQCAEILLTLAWEHRAELKINASLSGGVRHCKRRRELPETYAYGTVTQIFGLGI